MIRNTVEFVATLNASCSVTHTIHHQTHINYVAITAVWWLKKVSHNIWFLHDKVTKTTLILKQMNNSSPIHTNNNYYYYYYLAGFRIFWSFKPRSLEMGCQRFSLRILLSNILTYLTRVIWGIEQSFLVHQWDVGTWQHEAGFAMSSGV